MRIGLGTLVCALVLAPACAEETVPARAQLLVVVDTDAPVLEQTTADPALSRAVAVDTVRVDLLDEADRPTVFREFSATNPLDWPLSFAIVASDAGKRARLRVRAYRAKDAVPGIENGTTTLVPAPELTIDRIVELAVPTAGVDTRLVSLAGDCFGLPASFRDRTSCIANGARGAFGDAVPTATPGAGRRTAVGTWPRARAVPCASAPIAGSVCIPGGISVLGTRDTAGIEDYTTVRTLPQRLVEIAPFFMDRTELTVGRARRWLGRLATPPSKRGAAEVLVASQYCTLADDADEALPLNCVRRETAAELCALEGGVLPTEAQWNHAAAGRGDGRRYPWGDVDPIECCTVSASRINKTLPFPPPTCKQGEGPDRVGSHDGTGCAGPGDVSRDGVLDLGGNLREMLRDSSRPLDAPCWGSPFGILVNPTCAENGSDISIGQRGSDWSAGLGTTLTGIRYFSTAGATSGLRCVYSDIRAKVSP